MLAVCLCSVLQLSAHFVFRVGATDVYCHMPEERQMDVA